jgi:hypothetical protein
MNPEHPFYAFSDSSWNDDVDTGRSTGGCLIWYLGKVVDHSYNLLNLEACLAFIATNHL